jgi:hypothetical protein
MPTDHTVGYAGRLRQWPMPADQRTSGTLRQSRLSATPIGRAGPITPSRSWTASLRADGASPSSQVELANELHRSRAATPVGPAGRSTPKRETGPTRPSHHRPYQPVSAPPGRVHEAVTPIGLASRSTPKRETSRRGPSHHRPYQPVSGPPGGSTRPSTSSALPARQRPHRADPRSGHTHRPCQLANAPPGGSTKRSHPSGLPARQRPTGRIHEWVTPVGDADPSRQPVTPVDRTPAGQATDQAQPMNQPTRSADEPN